MFEAKTGDGQCQNCPFKPDNNKFANSVHYFVFLCVRVVDAHDEGVVNDLGSVNRDEDNDDEDDEDDGDDIYIMMKCLSVCVSRKTITSSWEFL